MKKNQQYVINSCRIDDKRNVEVKAHVTAKFDGILRDVDFKGIVPLDLLLEYALKHVKLVLATNIRLKAGVKGPQATWSQDTREYYEYLWALVQKHGVDFANPEPSDPAGKLRKQIKLLIEMQREVPEVDIQDTIDHLRRRIKMLES